MVLLILPEVARRLDRADHVEVEPWPGIRYVTEVAAGDGCVAPVALVGRASRQSVLERAA
jgi:hypothetical protein